VLRGGADVLQLRHKTLPRGQLLDLARRLRYITAEAGALFIVNDHVDIAPLLNRSKSKFTMRHDVIFKIPAA